MSVRAITQLTVAGVDLHTNENPSGYEVVVVVVVVVTPMPSPPFRTTKPQVPRKAATSGPPWLRSSTTCTFPGPSAGELPILPIRRGIHSFDHANR